MKKIQIPSDILPRLQMYANYIKQLRAEMNDNLHSISCVKKAFGWFDHSSSMEADLKKLKAISLSLSQSPADDELKESARICNELVSMTLEEFKLLFSEALQELARIGKVQLMIAQKNSSALEEINEENREILGIFETKVKTGEASSYLLEGMRLTFSSFGTAERFEYFKSVTELFARTDSAELVADASTLDLAIKGLGETN
jgi:hypothetical protein